MSDAPDVDDRVDYEDGSSSEMEEEHVEEDDDDSHNDEEHDVEAEDEDNNIDIDIETAEDEEEEEREEYSHLLSLPPHGSEVFIGGLPRDVGEEDLRDLCEPIGDIFEVRLMKDRDSGENKGYAFGKTIRCSLSETKNRLFIGNIPKEWTEDEFRKVIEDVGPGVESIELIKVKALYVKNIPENTSTEQLKELFQRHGEVTKVVTPPGKGGKRDFGFVHYAERSSALKAVKDSERYEINGQELEVVLAKPQAERKHEPSSYSYGGAAAPSPAPFALPTFGGFAAPPYGAMGIAGSFAQPMIYGRGAMPTGMQMVPMLLPDGRVGYVLQQPGMQMAPPARPRRDDRNNGGSGRENRHHHDGNRGGRRYRPY
ncbi:RNA-binding (RRM/RBD/RNP motifs) family protein [Raphanus sativus]|nr:RNA-binding (RRM/RBD/RNP motifs) family protein [Raphanus sativus]